uniref:Putative head-tail joining protein n=1 Tax=viral metagenome TaxID=1070528 RepID=A0A6M3JYF5_9ZZZZ
MSIGSLNKLIDIQSKTRVADGLGGFTETYSTRYSNIYASISQISAQEWLSSAKEKMESNQMSMSLIHRIKIRYRGGIKPDWRIKYGNRYFSIASIVNPDEANEELILLCKEVRV